jgi:hypothetical protein
MRSYSVRYSSELFGISDALWDVFSTHEAAALESQRLQRMLKAGGYPRMAATVHVV